MARGQKLYEKAKKIIPGGTQLLSKRPEMFLPGKWPSYYKKAKGCEVWDLDGKKYIDMSYMAIGASVLGYADIDVDKAVKAGIDRGVVTTLNSPKEIELAEALLKLHPWAKMVRYASTGGEALTIAIRIARATARKDKVLFCGYHGWHDWYLSSNLADDKALDGHLLPGLKPKGVPRALKGTAIPFEYNDIKSFKELIIKHEKEVGVVIIEPIRNYYPKRGFLETIRKITKEKGIVLVADEVSSGFRLTNGGAHLVLGFTPDIAVFSKALANGYPVAAVIGTTKAMKAAEESFISSTNWTGNVGLNAALATIKKFRDKNVATHLEKIGKLVQEGWQKLGKKHQLDIKISGIYPLGHFSFNYENSLALKTLFTKKMLEKNILATTAFYASYAHTEKHVKLYLQAVDETFAFISKTIKEKSVEKYLPGEPCHAGFRRLT